MKNNNNNNHNNLVSKHKCLCKCFECICKMLSLISSETKMTNDDDGIKKITETETIKINVKNNNKKIYNIDICMYINNIYI